MQKITSFGRIAAIMAISATIFFTKGTIADAKSSASNDIQGGVSEHLWQGLSNYLLPADFQSDFSRTIDELVIEVHANGLVLAQDQRHIAKINPGGYLFVASDNGQGKITLTLSADNQGHVAFDYRINDLPIHSQRSAELFLAGVFNRLDSAKQHYHAT